MRNARHLLAALTATVFLTACGGSTQEGEANPAVIDNSTAPVATSAGSGANTQAIPGNNVSAPTGLDDQSSLLSQRVIYFNYDSSEVRDEDLAVVEAHARYLINTPSAGILLEGHADERGSREYNVALGERRALAVTEIMQLLGVPTTQLRTVSYGEERPAVEGNNESAWQRNRRVELVY